MKTWKTLAVGLLIGSLWAQQGAIRVGAVLLPQNTWLLNQDDSDAGSVLDYEPTYAFGGGFSTSYNFTDNLGVGLDLLYARHSQKYKGVQNNIAYTARTDLNFLKVPVLLRFNSDPNSVVQFNAFLGPQLNFLLGYKDRAEATVPLLGRNIQEVSGTEMTITIGNNPPNKEELTAPIYKNFLFGTVLGFGIGIKPTDQLLISLHVRADYSFGDAENKEAKINHSHGGHGMPGHMHEYWENKPKYGSSNAPANYVRPTTTAVAGGLQLGVYYTFGGR